VVKIIKNKNHKRWLENLVKAHGIEIDLVDIEGMYDSTLTWREIKNQFEEYLHKFGNDIIYQKDEQKTFDKDMEEKERHSIEEMIKTELEERRKMLEKEKIYPLFKPSLHMIKMVCKKFSPALIIEGGYGIGKSHLIEKVLNEMDVKWFMIAGYSSPRALVETVEEHKDDDIIWFDDLEGVVGDRIGKAILKACLDDRNKIRRIQYATKNRKFDFILNARVIICLNTLPTDIDFLAVKDRCLYNKIELSYEDKLNMMEYIGSYVPEDIPLNDRKDIFKFIKENSNSATEDFSLRTWFKICSMFKYDSNQWIDIALTVLKPDRNVLTVKMLIDKMIPVNDQIREFSDITGMGRATFFRYKKRLEVSKYQPLSIPKRELEYVLK
jgi:hypothetical protein